MHYRYLNINYDKEKIAQAVINNTIGIDWQPLNTKIDYYIGKPKDETILDEIKSQLPVWGGPTFMRNAPQVPHIDRTRQSAINFPLNVDCNFFVAKEYPTEWFNLNEYTGRPVGTKSQGIHKEEKNKGNRLFPHPLKGDAINHYDIKPSKGAQPYLLNIKVPHGAMYENNNTRFILSMSFNIPFEEMVELLGGIIK